MENKMAEFAKMWWKIATVHNWPSFTQQALAIVAEEYRSLIKDSLIDYWLVPIKGER